MMVLESEDTVEVVAEAEDGLEAVHKAEEDAPDVVFMDVRMPRRADPGDRRASTSCPTARS